MIGAVTFIRGGYVAKLTGSALQPRTVVVNRPSGTLVRLIGTQGPAGAPGASANDAAIGPDLTYTSNRLSRIDYDDGSFKRFTYDDLIGGRLDYFDFTKGAVTTRKQLVWNLDGTLQRIDQTTL